MGKLLADDLQLKPGDYVTLTSPAGHMTPFGMVPRSRRFRIAGIFDSGFYDYDANWGFAPCRRRKTWPALATWSACWSSASLTWTTPTKWPLDSSSEAGPGLHGHNVDG